MSDKSRVKALRKKLRVTQRKLAGILGISLRTVQGWETGKPLSALGLVAVQSLETLSRGKSISRSRSSLSIGSPKP